MKEPVCSSPMRNWNLDPGLEDLLKELLFVALLWGIEIRNERQRKTRMVAGL